MRIASDIKGYGMSAANDLINNIRTLVGQEVITKVIETGTYMGLGTTKAVLKGMREHEMEFEFYSIEVNPQYAKMAMKNNVGVKGLHILNGLSVPKSQLPTDATFNVPNHVIVDYKPHERFKNYMAEVSHNVPDCLLKVAIEKLDGIPELVILDSAGHMGLIEFKYLMSLVPHHEFYLLLDDIGHVKHYETLQLIKSNESKYNVIWESDQGEIHRSAVIKVSDD